MFDLFGNQVQPPTRCSATEKNGGILLKTPFDPAVVAQIKALPASMRRWDPDETGWLISTACADQVRGIVMAYFGEELQLHLRQVKPTLETRILEVHYIGACKDRNGESLAFGLNARDAWEFVFPELVLRSWFETPEQELRGATLYALLGTNQAASPEQLQSAYRRMARQWHPDVCKETGAHEAFIKIQNAYALLGNPQKRAKYDAGLALEQTLNKPVKQNPETQFRSPLRCGLILAEGQMELDRFLVRKIMAWEDIINGHGQTLISSWPVGADKPTRVWA